MAMFIGTIAGIASSITLTLIKKRQVAYVGLVSMISASALLKLSYQLPHISYLFFYWVGFCFSVFFTTLVIYILYFRPYKKHLLREGVKQFISFFDFITLGYSSFDSKMNRIFEDNSASEKLELQKQVKKYLHTALMYKFLYETNSPPSIVNDDLTSGYLTVVMVKFRNIFFADEKDNVRFTFRQLDSASNSMKTILTSRKDRVPSAIPLNVTNLIQASLDQGCVAMLYSRNKHLHYDSKSGSIQRGIYQDYMSMCLLGSNGKPIYSLCIDVNGKSAQQRLHEIVDSGGFKEAALAISTKISKIVAEANAVRVVAGNSKPNTPPRRPTKGKSVQPIRSKKKK